MPATSTPTERARVLRKIRTRVRSRDVAYRMACGDIGALIHLAREHGASMEEAAEAAGLTRVGAYKFMERHGP